MSFCNQDRPDHHTRLEKYCFEDNLLLTYFFEFPTHILLFDQYLKLNPHLFIKAPLSRKTSLALAMKI